MKPRTTIILVVCALALLLFVRFYESKLPTTREAADRSQHVLDLDRDKIDAITITNNETKIEFRKRDGQWFLDAPVKDRADSLAVDQLITSAEMIRKEGQVSERAGDKDRLKDFGLGKPTVRLKFSGPKASPELLFGKDAAIEGKIYVRLENSRTAYVVNNDLKNQVLKKVDDFRDRKLTELNATQVNKMVIKSAAGEIELEKTQSHWQINKPLKARGDDQKIADAISQIINTRIESFVADNAEKSGLNEPRGTVTFFAEGSDKPAVLQIGAVPENDKEKTYAKISTRDSVCIVPKKIDEAVALKPSDLRDKRLVRLNMDTVDRIHIEPRNGEKITLARKGESWVIKGTADKAANTAQIHKLTSDLQNQQVAAFTADTASELAKFGLDQPQLKISFSAFASENTAETKAGENPIQSIAFGKVEGENVYAKLEDEPFIVAINKSILGTIPTESIQWQDLAIFHFKPDEIESVEITKNQQPTIEVARAEKGAWKVTKGDGTVEQNNVQSLCNTLATLHAVRWGTRKVDAQAFANPAVNVTFKTKDKTNTLIVAAPLPDGNSTATAKEVDGTFLISRPDVEALQLPLVAAASPSPVPPASAAPAAAK